MAEGGVLLHDVGVGHALGVQEGAQDLVGGAGIDVVRAQEHETLGLAAVLAHEIFHGGNGLLVGGRSGIEHVVGAFLALVLHGVVQQAVQFLEDREHGLAATPRSSSRTRAATFSLVRSSRAFSAKRRPVGGRVHHNGLDLLAQQAALGVQLLDGHESHVLEGGFADGHGAGQGMEDADLDRVLGQGVCPSQKSQCHESQPKMAYKIVWFSHHPRLLCFYCHENNKISPTPLGSDNLQFCLFCQLFLFQTYLPNQLFGIFYNIM